MTYGSDLGYQFTPGQVDNTANWAGTNYYQQFPGLQARETQHNNDLTNLYETGGYLHMDQFGQQQFDDKKFFNDYWASANDDPSNRTGVYAQHNDLLNNYYNDLNAMGVKGKDGQQISLDSKNMPDTFQGAIFQSAPGQWSFGTPDQHTYDYQGPSNVMGHLQTQEGQYGTRSGLPTYDDAVQPGYIPHYSGAMSTPLGSWDKYGGRLLDPNNPDKLKANAMIASYKNSIATSSDSSDTTSTLG